MGDEGPRQLPAQSELGHPGGQMIWLLSPMVLRTQTFVIIIASPPLSTTFRTWTVKPVCYRGPGGRTRQLFTRSSLITKSCRLAVLRFLN